MSLLEVALITWEWDTLCLSANIPYLIHSPNSTVILSVLLHPPLLSPQIKLCYCCNPLYPPVSGTLHLNRALRVMFGVWPLTLDFLHIFLIVQHQNVIQFEGTLQVMLLSEINKQTRPNAFCKPIGIWQLSTQTWRGRVREFVIRGPTKKWRE